MPFPVKITVEKTIYYRKSCLGKAGLWKHNTICTGLSDKETPKVNLNSEECPRVI